MARRFHSSLYENDTEQDDPEDLFYVKYHRSTKDVANGTGRVPPRRPNY